MHFARDRQFWISHATVDTSFQVRSRNAEHSRRRSHCSSREAHKRKAGRLGNDRPSLEARLGVGCRSLGVCGKGASTKRPGEPPAGYLTILFSTEHRRWQTFRIRTTSRMLKPTKASPAASSAKLHISVFQKIGIPCKFGLR